MTAQTDYEAQAKAFLDKWNIAFTATRSNAARQCPPWHDKPSSGGCYHCGGIHGDRYNVTLAHVPQGTKDTPYQHRQDKLPPHGCSLARLSFPFWNSQHDAATGKMPTAYDVLACISSDLHCPDNFEDFCAEYGYEEDSRKALATFKRCADFAEKLNAFFSEGMQLELQHIS